MYDAIEKLLDSNIHDRETMLFYSTSMIKNGLDVGFFEKREGFIVYGGIRVIDTLKKDFAIADEY